MTANLQQYVLIQFPDDLEWQLSTLRLRLLYESVLRRELFPVPTAISKAL